MFLGPDVGWQDSVFDAHRSCRENITRVETTCGTFFTECVLFLDVLHEHPDQTASVDIQRWSAEGTLVLASRPGATVLGSAEETILVEMLRQDISDALITSKDFISILDIETAVPYPPETPPAGEVWLEVTYEVTNDVSEVGVLRQIHSIEHQAKQPGSLLLQGDATDTVISAGDVAREIILHPCRPVFLGPDVGFVDIFQANAAGSCELNVLELDRVCGVFVTECLRHLYPDDISCTAGLTVANSNRDLTTGHTCSGVVRFCSENLEFCINNHEFRSENDEFCIENAEFFIRWVRSASTSVALASHSLAYISVDQRGRLLVEAV